VPLHGRRRAVPGAKLARHGARARKCVARDVVLDVSRDHLPVDLGQVAIHLEHDGTVTGQQLAEVARDEEA